MSASHAAHAGPWGCPPWAAIARTAFAAMSGGGRQHGKRFSRPGPWSWGPSGPGPFPPGFGPFGGQHFWGRKAKRGNVRAAILALLAEEPRNGYQIIQAINERSGGAWKPSPGAVYPALSQLADEGLIRGDESEGRKTFHLTDAGRAYIADHQSEVAAPWEDVTADLHDDVHGLFKLAGQTGMAIVQVAQAGSPAQVAQATEILSDTRRRLYQLLADDDNAGDGPRTEE